MKKLLFLLMLLTSVSMSMSAKKYPWKGLDHGYEITFIRNNSKDSQLLKVFAISSSADAAITQALQDAVAAAIFTGYTSKMHDNQINPIYQGFAPEGSGPEFYNAHKAYFDKFFKTGEFLKYATNVNTAYPSGENNMKSGTGRRVGVNVSVQSASLRERLINDGIIKKLGMER